MRPEQLALGSVFTLMGVGTMLFPHQLIPLSFPHYSSALVSAPPLDPHLVLTFRCFGAQASLVGMLLLSAKLTKRAYRNFGLAMLPFVAFDYLAWHQGLISTLGALGDLAGNAVFIACSWKGYRRRTSREDDDEDEDD